MKQAWLFMTSRKRNESTGEVGGQLARQVWPSDRIPTVPVFSSLERYDGICTATKLSSTSLYYYYYYFKENFDIRPVE
ncbi:E3 ubiquitin-protein ligase [Trichinella spiralis]|uniref:E3 ubiquitin-protein ligase n=1 Tax=Trichinella spiralis TaxID=6334 RepID=A0ABR3KEG1_TRISP